MTYLLDTSVVLWALKYPGRLGPETTKIIKDQNPYISVGSLWEVTIKVRSGKLQVPLPVKEILNLMACKELPITLDHVDELMNVNLPHKDPFDAILVAQAKTEGLTLVTSDTTLLNSPYSTFAAKL